MFCKTSLDVRLLAYFSFKLNQMKQHSQRFLLLAGFFMLATGCTRKDNDHSSPETPVIKVANEWLASRIKKGNPNGGIYIKYRICVGVRCRKFKVGTSNSNVNIL